MSVVLKPEQQIQGTPDKVLRHEGATCALWWSHTPRLEGKRIGFIGHYQATGAQSAAQLLDAACHELAAHGVDLAVGPVDGSTWNSYRFISWSSGEAPFFLEPQNSAEYPAHFQRQDFTALAKYYSAVTDDLDDDEQAVTAIETRLCSRGIVLRPMQMSNFQDELRSIYSVCEESFADNFLYSPISEAQFIAQYSALQALCDPQLILIAEQKEKVVGFVFALPNIACPQSETIIVKTLARLPQGEFAGLGHLLLAKVQRQAKALGYKRSIHALMHQSNQSVALSNRYARTFREYELLSRALTS